MPKAWHRASREALKEALSDAMKEVGNKDGEDRLAKLLLGNAKHLDISFGSLAESASKVQRPGCLASH